MSRDHAVRHQSREKEPNSDFIVANFEKETASGTLHALSELQELSKKDPKAFAKVLEKVNAKVDTSYLSIGEDGKSRGDLEIVGFDKGGSLILKDKSTDELFDPRVNLKNGILEISRPITVEEQPKAAYEEPRHLAPVETREFKPVAQEELNFDSAYKLDSAPGAKRARIEYPGESKPAASAQIEYPGEPKAAPSREYIEYPR